jgi:hypothetical protein
MSGCNNYTLTGANNGDTHVNAVGDAGVHLRVSNIEQLAATSGSVSVFGAFSATGTKNFRIDHPREQVSPSRVDRVLRGSESLQRERRAQCFGRSRGPASGLVRGH